MTDTLDVEMDLFWFIWLKCQRACAVMNCSSYVGVVCWHCRHHAALLSSLLSVGGPPGHGFDHTNFIFYT